MFLPKLSLVAPMGLGFVAVQFPAHCSWSNLEKNGANISGLIFATQRIIDKLLAINHNTPAQPQLTQDEVDTVVDYIAAMELEKSVFNLPDSHARASRKLLEYLKSTEGYNEAIAKIAERKKYYTFFYRNPYVNDSSDINQDYANNFFKWSEERQKRIEEGKSRFQPFSQQGSPSPLPLPNSHEELPPAGQLTTDQLSQLFQNVANLKNQIDQIYRALESLMDESIAHQSSLSSFARRIIPNPQAGGKTEEPK